MNTAVAPSKELSGELKKVVNLDKVEKSDKIPYNSNLAHFSRTYVFIAIVLGILAVALRPENYMKDCSKTQPWSFIIVTHMLSRALHSLANHISPPPPVQVLDDIFGKLRSEVIYVCSRLNIPDILKDHFLTIEEISSIAEIDGNNLLRLLRAAESFGYFREDMALNAWGNSRLSSTLRTDHPNSVRDLVHHQREDMFPAWKHLYSSIKFNEDAFQKIHNMSVWEYFETHPAQKGQFSRALANFDTFSSAPQAQDYNWSKYNRMVDLGGNLGSLLSEIMKVNPAMMGLLFDLPSVIENAKAHWNSAYDSDFIQRVKFQEGSFFNISTLPHFQEGDVINLRYVLHNWKDDDCIKILTNIRKCIANSKQIRLVLNEIVLAPKDNGMKFIADLNMKVVSGNAMERYAKQWEHLLTASSFRLVQIFPTRSLNSIIEAEPV